MADPKIFNDNPYYPHSEMIPAPGAGPSPLATASEDRQSYSPRLTAIDLRSTAGVYVTVGGGHDIRFVIDRNSIGYLSPQWRLIAETADRLAACFPTLSAQGRRALNALKAVVFSKSPLRGFADVDPDIFFYDTDEFVTQDGVTLISPAYAASNIVHDANHIWMHDNGVLWHGVDAEKTCWLLQVENKDALGLEPHEVAFLDGLIANPPPSVLHRLLSAVV